MKLELLVCRARALELESRDRGILPATLDVYVDANDTLLRPGSLILRPQSSDPISGWQGADLSSRVLRGYDFRAKNLVGAKLTNSDLTGANFTLANLAGADLTGATLVRANLTRANLTDADVTGADLSRARIDPSALTGAKGIGTHPSHPS